MDSNGAPQKNEFEELKTQLEKGTQKTNYECFSAGYIAPSVNYQLPIKKMTGDNTIICTGANLLNPITYNSNSAREKYLAYKDGVFTTIQANYSFQSYIFIGLDLDPSRFENGFSFFAIVEGTHNSGNLLFYTPTGRKVDGELNMTTNNTRKIFKKRFITESLGSVQWWNPKQTVGTTYKFFILPGNVNSTDAEFIKYVGEKFSLNLNQGNKFGGRYKQRIYRCNFEQDKCRFCKYTNGNS